MKHLIRTYVDPMLEDRLKLLTESSGISLSALTAELIQKGLESAHEPQNDTANPIWHEEHFYLQFLTLQIVLNSGGVDSEKFVDLKTQARQWAVQKSSNLNNQAMEN